MDLFHQSRILSNSMDKSFLPHLHFYHYHCCLRSRINVFAGSYSEKSNCHCFIFCIYTNKSIRIGFTALHMKKGRKRKREGGLHWSTEHCKIFYSYQSITRIHLPSCTAHWSCENIVWYVCSISIKWPYCIYYEEQWEIDSYT